MLLGLFVIVLPFAYTSGPNGLRNAQMMAFVLAGGLMGAVYVAFEVNRALGAVYACTVVSAIQAGFGPVHATSLCFVTAGVFLAVYASTFSIRDLRLFFKVLLFVGVLQALYGLVQMCGYDPFFERLATPDRWIPVGSLGQQTLYGPFMVVSISVALYLRPVLVPFLIVPALATFSTMTFLALIGVGSLYVVARWGGRVGAALFGLLCILGCIGYLIWPAFFLFDSQGRGAVWMSLVNLWLRRPWFGWGLGSYQVVGPLGVPSNVVASHGVFLQAHNDYLQVLFEMGVVGLLAGGYAFFEFCRAAKRAWRREEGKILLSIFVALAINALGSFPLHTPTLAVFFILSWIWIVSDSPWINKQTVTIQPTEERGGAGRLYGVPREGR